MSIVLITGGSSGIGKAIALSLAKQGNTIIITGRDVSRLELVKSEIEAKGANSDFYLADVRDSAKAKQIVNKVVQQYSAIDVLVANAGVGRFKNIDEFTEEDYDVQFDTNVKGVFNYLKPTVAQMKQQDDGQIIVTSSNLGFTTGARCGIYAATKYAIQAMIGALREELKGTGIKAGTINPGSVDTPWYDPSKVGAERRKKMLDPQDVANAAILMIEQSETSDIDHILLYPGVN